MQWPARSAICLDCRTTLPVGARCPRGTHRVASLAEPAGREALRERAWGPPRLRQELRRAARAGSVGGAAGLFDGCTCDGVDALDGHVLAALCLFIGVFLMWLGIRWIVRKVRARRLRRPRGVPVRRPPRVRDAAIGTIAPAATLPAPLDGSPCVAFGLELRHGRSAAMLRDGATLGFELVLDDGSRVRVPAGPCVIDVGDEHAERPPAGLAQYLATLDCDRGELTLFPGDRVAIACFAPGDRIAIVSPLAAADGAGSPYRSAEARIAAAPVCLRRIAA